MYIMGQVKGKSANLAQLPQPNGEEIRVLTEGMSELLNRQYSTRNMGRSWVTRSLDRNKFVPAPNQSRRALSSTMHVFLDFHHSRGTA